MTARRKVFFFEKKKQKTFALWHIRLNNTYAKMTKVFWFFFSKKNSLHFLESRA